MYKCIYFDLDDTLIKDHENSGRAYLLNDGLGKYLTICKEYPDVPRVLFTNRESKDIEYPSVYNFNEVLGSEVMSEYIKENLKNIRFSSLLGFRNIRLFLRGYILFKNGSTPKLLYLFLKHIVKGEEVLVFDDDMRVSEMF